MCVCVRCLLLLLQWPTGEKSAGSRLPVKTSSSPRHNPPSTTTNAPPPPPPTSSSSTSTGGIGSGQDENKVIDTSTTVVVTYTTTHSLTHPLSLITHPPTHSLSLNHSLTHSPTHSLTLSLTHSLSLVPTPAGAPASSLNHCPTLLLLLLCSFTRSVCSQETIRQTQGVRTAIIADPSSLALIIITQVNQKSFNKKLKKCRDDSCKSKTRPSEPRPTLKCQVSYISGLS